MKYLFTILFLLLGSATKSQFSFISHKDCFVNVRVDATGNSKIIDSLKNGDLIFCFSNSGNWMEIDYNKLNHKRHGYIYKDRHTLIEKLPAIPRTKQSASTITLSNDSIEITVADTSFIKHKHRYKYHEENKTAINLIDGKQYWGTDGELPKKEYAYINIKIGQKQISLPAAALQNLFEPNLFATAANYENTTRTLYIYALNSDGAGSYWIIWKLANGIYKERFIVYGF